MWIRLNPHVSAEGRGLLLERSVLFRRPRRSTTGVHSRGADYPCPRLRVREDSLDPWFRRCPEGLVRDMTRDSESRDDPIVRGPSGRHRLRSCWIREVQTTDRQHVVVQLFVVRFDLVLPPWVRGTFRSTNPRPPTAPGGPKGPARPTGGGVVGSCLAYVSTQDTVGPVGIEPTTEGL